MPKTFKTVSPSRKKIYYLQKKSAIRRDYLNGITCYQDLARRHDVSTFRVSQIIQRMASEMVEQDAAIAMEQVAIAERRLLMVYQRAHKAFTRSRRDGEMTTTTRTPKKCKVCKGTGMAGKGDEWCVACDGDGEIVEETVVYSRRGQTGDPNFLRIQVDCMKELNRLRGLYVNNKEKIPQAHLHLHQNIERLDLSKVPDDVLLKAIETMDQLKTLPAPIDVESVPVGQKQE